MATIDLEAEVRELKRRLDLTETRLSQLDGRFEYISGQLRDIQLYMHARFDDIDKRFDKLDGRFDKQESRFDRLEGRSDKLDAKVDALPRVIAEMIGRKAGD